MLGTGTTDKGVVIAVAASGAAFEIVVNVAAVVAVPNSESLMETGTWSADYVQTVEHLDIAARMNW